MLVNQVHTFRSKMAKAAETYAELYDLPSIVDPDGLLPPTANLDAICTYCEEIHSPKNWKIYYLHESDTKTRKFNLFSNPTFLLFHSEFWYTHAMSLVWHQESIPWNTTPLQLLSISAAALACGLRRVWQPQVTMAKSKRKRTVRYSANYHKQQIIYGMEKTLLHECPDTRCAFQQLLHQVHEDGLQLKASRQSTDEFFIPSAMDMRSLQLNTYATQPLGISQAIAGPSSQGLVAYDDPGWVLMH
ncbi:hypothetical protein JVU11DRAFT_10188 [Chiua virens]|nr:hypothetical protein JVU11DRAFT_10188 [Chiua virens]